MPEQRLGPKAIAGRLFAVDPDRDERASQLCMEALLTIAANGYSPPDGKLRSPKLRRFAVRSLVLGQNFLDAFPQSLRFSDITAERYGVQLAAAEDFQGADNLSLARTALRNLVDPSTEQGQAGQHLMLPFHESLLWYDARPTAGVYSVRKVRMRGSGIAFARMLLDPDRHAGLDAAELGKRAVAGLRKALTLESPLAEIARALESVLPDDAVEHPRLEDDEARSWELGANPQLGVLTAAICRHSEGVMCQGGASSAARLWQLRTMLALDLAVNSLRQAWEAIDAPDVARHLLLALAGPERQEDRTRLRSERSYSDARTAIRWATVETIALRMRELDAEGDVDWAAELEGRTARLLEDAVVAPLRLGGADFHRLAQLAFENANYDRSGEGFRVLIESIGMSAGGTRYRYLSATPDLLSALVGALSREMPMTSARFFARVAAEWGLVISPEAAVGTAVGSDLDGADLAVNARRFEKVMVEAGLATGISDRTVLVGERAGQREAQ